MKKHIIYTLKQIETPRLIIRPVQLGDEIPLNKAINNSLDSLQKWLPWAYDPSIEATRAFIQNGVFSWQSKSIVDFPMVMIHKIDEKIIGGCGYNDHSDIDNDIYEIGYWCDIDYQGQGLVTECANALTKFAFDELKATNVIIMMKLENEKSIAVAERLGFTNEGIRTHDPLDCVTENPEKNYIYSTGNTKNLPSLEILCTYNNEDSINTEIITWAKEELKITNNKAFAESRVIISTPWSMVLEINTGNTLIYLKQTPEKLALEAEILQFLHDQCHVNVPKVISHNKELNCFLMKDAGRPLRETLKQHRDIKLYCKAINTFTSMQLATANHVNTLIEMGVLDWRLNKLPELYLHLLTQQELLGNDGLTQQEITELKILSPVVSALSQQLASLKIPATIVQPDFHDNNILMHHRSEKMTVIDLGEIVISHPFFSLTNCLYQAKRHHGLTNQDSDYHDLIAACLHPFQTAASKQEAIDALALANDLSHVYQALAYHRLMQACNTTHLHSLYGSGRISGHLKQFMIACRQANDS